MNNELTLEERATNAETLKHILTVQHYLNRVVHELLRRSEAHDQSKLEQPEVAAFTEWTPKLAGSTYGSEEYAQFRQALGPALDHHYAKNRHHPEHFPAMSGLDIDLFARNLDNLKAAEGVSQSFIRHLERLLANMESPINGMNLVDLVEMFADWKAATMRHHDGNLLKSIEVNAKRFAMSPQLEAIFRNTAELFD